MAQIPNDTFETYYIEKLWAMVPDIYRYNDGFVVPPGILRSIIELMAHEAAFVRRSNDRVWEDQYIELCDEWAVPYIGALVATRMLSDKNLRGRRVDVAKTIYYRRRKGTPRVLEELISDISGWNGVVVEEFRRLGRARHGLDPFPAPLAGRLTGTMPGGWADLRDAGGSELAGGPFEEYFHTADMRYPEGLDGRYGIPKIAFYLYRLQPYLMAGVTPYRKDMTELLFTFDPSGRNTQLFNYLQRPLDWSDWHPALEWEVPAPIRCRLLGDAEYLITQAAVNNIPGLTGAQQAELANLFGYPFRNETSLRAVVASYTGSASYILPLLKNALIPDCGKSFLLPSAISVSCAAYLSGVPVEQTTAGNLSQTPTTPDALVVDPVQGQFRFMDSTTDVNDISVMYYMGFSGPLGAGGYTRPIVPPTGAVVTGGIFPGIPPSGVLEIGDNLNYTPPGVTNVTALTIEAGDQLRPYLPLAQSWVFAGVAGSVLVLDGLWIGAVAGNQFNIELSGTFASVTLRNCTLDPGGDTTIDGKALKAVHLVVTGTIDQLCIDNSIVGPIAIVAGTGTVESLTVCDTIIQSTDGSIALEMDAGQTTMENVTVFGTVKVDHLEASGVAVTGNCKVADTQHGCFRFSVAPDGSRVPRPYECLLFKGDSNAWWNSQRFGDGDYAQLSDVAPAKLLSGGDQGYEIGAFASLLNPFKQSDLEAKVQEYMPFGLIPIFIHQT